MRFAAAKETAHPNGGLFGLVEVFEIRVEDAVDAPLVFAFADKSFEFVADNCQALVVFGGVDFYNAIIQQVVFFRIECK